MNKVLLMLLYSYRYDVKKKMNRGVMKMGIQYYSQASYETATCKNNVNKVSKKFGVGSLHSASIVINNSTIMSTSILYNIYIYILVIIGQIFLDFGFWILDFGFWILDFGFWILDFGFWISSSRFFGFYRLHILCPMSYVLCPKTQTRSLCISI